MRITVWSPVHNWCLAPDHVCVDTLETGVRATGHHQSWVSSGNKQCQVVTIIITRLQTWRRSHCSILCSQTLVITVICRVNTNHQPSPPDTLLSIELTLRTTVEMVRPHSSGEGWPGVTVPNIFMTVCIFSPQQWRVKRPISILAAWKVMAANICNHSPVQYSVARGWYIANIFWRFPVVSSQICEHKYSKVTDAQMPVKNILIFCCCKIIFNWFQFLVPADKCNCATYDWSYQRTFLTCYYSSQLSLRSMFSPS